ncbi:uncharacterized protein BXZ73DRAFT_42563 [Epithele typhae]|uniref:uncharacterized protein n=1 Tax=Epithele typhae TaxID=378194 RepID=UPI002008E714|nr:uncharacterized protein BXZ73DRAFT_42563 [Epithele typhae]KAH9940919.1 hypothetical protein BXZ73DRAFT_42563 [Epithele typhae]
MTTPGSSAAALKLEIERLKGAINQHKTGAASVRPPVPATSARPRANVYVNPNYKPPLQTSYPQPAANSAPRPVPRPAPRSVPSSTQDKRDVVIDGIAFESSGRSLVRKDLPKPVVTFKPPSTSSAPSTTVPPKRYHGFVRNKAGTLMNSARPYKPKSSIRGRPMNRNMTLDNTRRPYQSRRMAPKRKYSDKPCPRFTTTGSCNRGLTCMYQHDPSKIAICWPFLQGSCTHTADSCLLSHDPTPERTPLCVHFANNGRCTRAACPFPHVRVGPREGICRDFAVLGYCAKGVDCDHQHVRECPDFAEKGQCTTKGCKLPHVIRANRVRKPTSSGVGPSTATSSAAVALSSSSAGSDGTVASDGASSSRQVAVEEGQLGDEFISLTFNESESDESDEEEDEDEEEGEEEGSESDDDSADHASNEDD